MSTSNSIVRNLDTKKTLEQKSVAFATVRGDSTPNTKEAIQKAMEQGIDKMVEKTMKENDTHIVVVTITDKIGTVMKNFVKCCQQPALDKFVNNFVGMGFTDITKQDTAAA